MGLGFRDALCSRYGKCLQTVWAFVFYITELDDRSPCAGPNIIFGYLADFCKDDIPGSLYGRLQLISCLLQGQLVAEKELVCTVGLTNISSVSRIFLNVVTKISSRWLREC